MFRWQRILVLLCIACTFGLPTHTGFPTIEALKSGICRMSIPADIREKSDVKIKASIESTVKPQLLGAIFSEENQKINNRWVVNFECNVRPGQELYFRVLVTGLYNEYASSGYYRITELLDNFSESSNEEHGAEVMVSSKPAVPRGSIIFSDEFDGLAINTSKWAIEHMIPTFLGPNFEFNTYEDLDTVRFIQNGKLYIKPMVLNSEEKVRGALDLTEGCTSKDRNGCYFQPSPGFILPPVISAKIKSKVLFKYGKFEIRAKLPQGDWIYPILQLEPVNKNSNSPNIWIAYSRGNIHLKGADPGDYGSSFLLGGISPFLPEPRRSQLAKSIFSNTSYSDDYHIYTLDWTPARMSLYIDNMLYGDVPTSSIESSFDTRYELTIGLAVGGVNDFPDDYHSGENAKPWINKDKNRLEHFFDARRIWLPTWNDNKEVLQIDYVKVTAV